jgi:hypothetical protein
MIPRDDNLRHVLYGGTCHDPDCEIHNLGVAIEEETVNATILAFYYAAAQEVRDMFLFGELPISNEADDEERLDAVLAEIRKLIERGTQ